MEEIFCLKREGLLKIELLEPRNASFYTNSQIKHDHGRDSNGDPARTEASATVTRRSKIHSSVLCDQGLFNKRVEAGSMYKYMNPLRTSRPFFDFARTLTLYR